MVTLSLCSLFRESGVDAIGTLPLNRKHVPRLVQSKNVAQGGPIAAERNGIVALASKNAVIAEGLIEWYSSRNIPVVCPVIKVF
jgi:hypothetical protein